MNTGMRFFSVLMTVCVVIVALGVMTACTQSTKSAPTTATADETGPYDWEREGTIPALDLADMERAVDRVDVFEEMPIDDDGLAVEDVNIEEVLVPDEPADSTLLVGQGYRVQIFASGNHENCVVVQQAAEMKLGLTAYVEHIEGIYKVRVGDCFSRSEAEALLRRCREAGYGDAWIVASEVRRARPEVQPEGVPEDAAEETPEGSG